jgi:hypothetical protein
LRFTRQISDAQRAHLSLDADLGNIDHVGHKAPPGSGCEYSTSSILTEFVPS